LFSLSALRLRPSFNPARRAQRAQQKAVQRVAGSTINTRFSAFVDEASQRFGVPTAWIRGVMRAESFGAAHAVSPKGAMGLMQIMPAIWASLRQRYHLGADPCDAHRQHHRRRRLSA